MRFTFWISFFLLTVFVVFPTFAAPSVPLKSPAEADILKTLRPGHPRLLVLPDDLARIKNYRDTDATAKGYYAAIVKRGETILTQPPVQYVLIGPRLLDKSRTALDRINTLSLLYRLSGDKKWADRAIAEMMAVSAFPDWHPAHFLDTAEMTHAVAIGYDWLYDVLTLDQRVTIKTAIIEFGLMRGKEAYEGTQPWKWWVGVDHNWNLVCNGGMIAGALAVADDDPALAKYILAHALQSLPKAVASYGPDGAWNEGPAYWGYATHYAVLAFSALQTGLGTDFDLSKMPGLAQTGEFRLQSVGPTNRFFNFADAGERAGDEPALFWLARRYHDPLLAWGARQAVKSRASADDLINYDPSGSQSEIEHTRLDAKYTAANVAFLRSSWTDPNAIFVGFKGGDNKANHSHLDLGTFVLDALGERWAIDLGSDEYDMPGYFGKERFTYYRLKTSGHNTLTLDGENQDTKAAAPLIGFHSEPSSAYAIADLSDGYGTNAATHIKRGIVLIDKRSSVLIQDELTLANPSDIVWTMHTHAVIAIAADGRQATLTQNGKTLTARILDTPGAVFSTEEISLEAPQHPTPNTRKLLLRWPTKQSSVRMDILLTPGESAPTLPKIVPIADWAKH